MKRFFYCVCILIVSTSIVKAQDKFVNLKGIVKSYSTKTEACFFIDPQMISAGVAKRLPTKTTGICVDPKYGKGAVINFDGLMIEGAYSTPPKVNVMIEVSGYWKQIANGNSLKTFKFMVSKWEPLF